MNFINREKVAYPTYNVFHQDVKISDCTPVGGDSSRLPKRRS